MIQQPRKLSVAFSIALQMYKYMHFTQNLTCSVPSFTGGDHIQFHEIIGTYIFWNLALFHCISFLQHELFFVRVCCKFCGIFSSFKKRRLGKGKICFKIWELLYFIVFLHTC
jgi:hypothetical protein